LHEIQQRLAALSAKDKMTPDPVHLVLAEGTSVISVQDLDREMLAILF